MDGPHRDSDAELDCLEASGMMELGRIEHSQGNYAKAILLFETAQEIYSRHHSSGDLGLVFGSIGSVYQDWGQLNRAREYYERSLAHLREVGNRKSEGMVVGNLGAICHAQGLPDQAEALLNEAIDTLRSIGHKVSEANFLGHLGNLMEVEGRHEEAMEVFKRSLQLHQEVGSRGMEGVALANIGHLLAAQGQLEAAIETMTQAVARHEEVGNSRDYGIDRGNMGDLLFRMGKLEEAETAFREAVPICDETFPVAAGAFRGSLALILAHRDQIEEALAMLEYGEPQVTPDRQEIIIFLCKKGQVQLIRGQIEEASSSLRQARAIAEEIHVGEGSNIARSVNELAGLLSLPD